MKIMFNLKEVSGVKRGGPSPGPIVIFQVQLNILCIYCINHRNIPLNIDEIVIIFIKKNGKINFT